MATRAPKSIRYEAPENERSLQTRPSPMDVHVGARVRLRRMSCQLSVEQLADMVGLSRPMMDRFEKGGNRLSVGRLFDIAKALETEPGWFFEEYTGGVPKGAPGKIMDAATLASMQFASNYLRLSAEERLAVRVLMNSALRGAGLVVED